MNVASVSEGCCKRLFKMFHLFLDVCCNRFDLDVAYVFTHMLQKYVPKCFICFSLSIVASVFMLQVTSVLSRYSICFLHKLQVYFPDVSSVSDI